MVDEYEAALESLERAAVNHYNTIMAVLFDAVGILYYIVTRTKL